MLQRCLAVVMLLVFSFAVVVGAAVPAGAQFASGLVAASTPFDDPDGLFSLTLPAGWSYQPDDSGPGFRLFYGPVGWDIFYVESLELPHPQATALEVVQSIVAHYESPDGLEGFQMIARPAPGQLGGKPAVFTVYAYDEAGEPIIEGRGVVVHAGVALTLAFSDRADLFEASTPAFNAVMESLVLHEPAAAAPAGFTFGNVALPSGLEGGISGGTGGITGTGPGSGGTGAGGNTGTGAAGGDAGVYTGPSGHFTFVPPAGWELWEEQSTRRGDPIEPWHTLLDWPGRPVSKSLFIWDYFDEWEQVGAQYEIVLAVIENVPGALNQSIDTLVRQIAGANAHIYTASNSRERIGNQTGMAVQVTVRPGLVEPWSLGIPWFREHTFYTLKQGLTLFVWVVPNEIVDLPEVAAALESFRWVAR